MKKLFAAIFALLVLTTPAFGEPHRVRLAQFGQAKFLLYLPLYLAMEEDYFRDQNIEVSLVFAGNDDQIFAALASGSTEFALGDPIFTAIAAERGFKAKTVALMINKLALYGYTKNRAMAPINAGEDLSGLRVGSFPAPSTTFTLLSQLNTTLKNPMKIVPGGQGTQRALLLANKVDIALDLEPAAAIAEEEGHKIVLDLARFTEPSAITGLMTKQSTIDSNPKLVQGMVTALKRALQTIASNPERVNEVAKRLFPELSDTVRHNALSRMRASNCYPSDTLVPEELWKTAQKTRLDRGELKAIQPLNLAVDNQFSEQAKP